MSLSISLMVTKPVAVFNRSITANLWIMAEEAGIYPALWKPDENGIRKAGQLVSILTEGLELLKADPKRFKRLDHTSGWGTYADFVPWLEELLKACKENPDADVEVSGRPTAKKEGDL